MTAPKEPRFKTIAELWTAPDRTVEDMRETREWLNYEAGYPMNEGPQPKPSDVLKAQGAVVGTTGGIIAVAGGGSPVSAAGVGVGVVGGALGATGHILGIMGMDEMEDPELSQVDSLTGETVGNLDEMHTPPFPFWDDAGFFLLPVCPPVPPPVYPFVHPSVHLPVRLPSISRSRRN